MLPRKWLAAEVPVCIAMCKMVKEVRYIDTIILGFRMM
jgi:hypothetical protein